VNGTRLSVCLPGASARTAADAALLAETANIDLWIGDPRGSCDDSYVMAAAAAVAAVTAHIRIGVFLTLRGSATPLRLAEDVGVVDQASRGRLELGLVAPEEGVAEWEAAVRSMLRGWHEWPAGGGRTVATTPAPAQPWLSRLVVGPAATADRLRGGVVVMGDAGPLADPPDVADRRTVLVVEPELGDGGVRGWLAPDPYGVVAGLRAKVDGVGAHEVLVVLGWPTPTLVDDIEALGVVVGTGLRCSAHQAPLLTPDAWRWLTELRHLHHAPADAPAPPAPGRP
jgi:hypothetical protein